MRLTMHLSRLWLFMLPVAGGLLVWSMNRAVLSEVLLILRSLKIWQIVLLGGINVALLLLFSARWWLILRASGKHLPYLRLSMYRIIGAAVSYVTPGPQFGGEPLQVALLRKHNLALPAAISSLLLDRSIELIANFVFLAVGIGLLAAKGMFGISVSEFWLPLVIVLAFPASYLAALRMRRSPLTRLLTIVFQKGKTQGWPMRVIEVTREAEREMAVFCSSRPLALIQIIFVTGLVWVGMILEYSLTVHLLGVTLDLPETVMALTAARIAFLSPLPAGLGLLEAGQVVAMEGLGFPAAAGLAVSGIIRTRDVLVTLIGLGFGIWVGWDWRKR